MIITFLLALAGPLAVFIGLVIFKNAFITFLLFHGFVCAGIPVVDLCIIKKYSLRSIIKSLGLIHSAKSLRIGTCWGIIFLTTIMLFFYIFKDHLIQINDIQLLLKSWNIQKGHLYILLFVMVFANSVLEEIYWRGYIFNRLKAHFNIKYVILISSLFYASYHYITTANLFSIQIGAIFTTVIFLTGIFWGTMREQFGSLYVPIISHFLADMAIMIIYLVFIQPYINC